MQALPYFFLKKKKQIALVVVVVLLGLLKTQSKFEKDK
eukprot:SAG31_NODE_9375_length_1288_cov_3.507149_1_plen_37_part_01